MPSEYVLCYAAFLTRLKYFGASVRPYDFFSRLAELRISDICLLSIKESHCGQFSMET